MDYMDWSRALIKRLRESAAAATAEADSLERSLTKYETEMAEAAERYAATHTAVTHTPSNEEVQKIAPAVKRAKHASKGDKNRFALEMLKTAPAEGLTVDTLFEAFRERFGPSYKRSSLRALLFYQKHNQKNVTSYAGRYMLAGAGAGANHGGH